MEIKKMKFERRFEEACYAATNYEMSYIEERTTFFGTHFSSRRYETAMFIRETYDDELDIENFYMSIA